MRIYFIQIKIKTRLYIYYTGVERFCLAQRGGEGSLFIEEAAAGSVRGMLNNGGIMLEKYGRL